ncbi:MAG: 23S rRNA (uracil(1939)-C(5))-methyltransferase RlmD [Flavobacteriales bacterium]|nr:23S rRNA (uracil(1939)-C(5))-methyltransferase RlmD [Flavobacteriales bacterium]MCB9204602.1 23S rRNA (uracil(1939)-C(5))-methyltransferase RlmD [Flavobacteriales bacterium]
MGRRRKNQVLEDVTILDIADKGQALARVNEMVVFVKGVVPGDVCDIQIKRKRKNYAEGYVTKIKELSPIRIDAKCKYFGVCGGCKWQNLSYAKQLEYKQKQVGDALQRIGKVKVDAFEPILGSENVFAYRNKLEFSFSHRRWLTQEEVDSGQVFDDVPSLGFHVPGRWDKVLDVKECHLMAEPSNAIRNRVREIALANDFSYYNLNDQVGFLRNLIVRSTMTGEWMVILSVAEDRPQDVKLILDTLVAEFPQLTSVLWVYNNKPNDTIADLDIQVHHGKDHIMEEMEGLKFRVGPKSFYQTNGPQAYELYKIARDFADLKGDEVVYDLYTGTGTIAQFVAKKAKKVVGIEYVEAAIDDAKLNAELNSIENTSFYAGDMKDVFTQELIEKEGKPDVVITDPPRAGMHADVVARLNELLPDRIVYVSCNPATQARDVQLLSTHYEVKKVRPVDMFPHTHHVESVALLERKATNE